MSTTDIHKDSLKTAVFDMDGTLVETTMANNHAYAKAVQEVCGIDVDISSERLTHRNLSMIYNFDSDTLKRIVEIKNQCYDSFLPMTYILPSMRILTALKGDGYRIVLLTNGKRKRINQILSYHSLCSVFDYSYYFEDYNSSDKYVWLFQNWTLNPDDLICFENETEEAQIAVSMGISHENIFLTNDLYI